MALNCSSLPLFLQFTAVSPVLPMCANTLDRSRHFESRTFLNRCHGSDVWYTIPCMYYNEIMLVVCSYWTYGRACTCSCRGREVPWRIPQVTPVLVYIHRSNLWGQSDSSYKAINYVYSQWGTALHCQFELYSNTTATVYRMAGRYFGRLLKICHLAEFTLAVEAVLAIIIFIAQWLIECAGNLTGPWASFRSVRMKSMIKCNSKLNKLLLHFLWIVFAPSVFTVTVYTSFRPPSLRCQGSQPFRSVYKTLWRSDDPYAAFKGKLHADD